MSPIDVLDVIHGPVRPRPSNLYRPCHRIALSTLLVVCTPQETPADDALQNSTVSVWLYEQLSIRIEGKIRVRTSPRLPRFPKNITDGA